MKTIRIIAWVACALLVSLMQAQVTEQVTAIQYYYNIDPGPGLPGNGAIIPVTPSADLNQSFSISLPGALPSGFHRLYIRVRDEHGRWSVAERRMFFIETLPALTDQITAYQFFFDIDSGVEVPGNGPIVPVTPTADLNQSIAIPLSGALADGFHRLYIRVKDEHGRWSAIERRFFYIKSDMEITEQVVAYQYFLDTDPGVNVPGNGAIVPVSPSDDLDQTIAIPLGTLTDGFHRLYIRVQDEHGRWSQIERRMFYIQNMSQKTENIVQLEYFLDTDPGAGNANPYPVTPTGDYQETIDLGVPCLATGTHYFYLRARDNHGRWSIIERDTLEITSGIAESLVTPTGPFSICTGGEVELSTIPVPGVTYQWVKDGDPVSGETSSTLTVTEGGDYALQAHCGSSFVLSNTVVVSELPQITYYADMDSDGYGDSEITLLDCELPPGYVTNDDDCDDANMNIHPTAAESCNLFDDDCDGMVDEGVQSIFYADTDEDGFGDPLISVFACTVPVGYVSNDDDCDDASVMLNPNATEICNLIDDDCDGNVDEGVLLTFYADTDNDGYGNPSSTVQGCTAPSGFISDNTDCNDADQFVHPGATEECNGVDDNCNGDVDEGFEYSEPAASINSSNGNSFCSGGSTLLSVVDGTLGTGAEWVWYEGGCESGTSIGTGNEIEVTPTGGAHTYYVHAEGTCNSTSCASILITVNFSPAFTTCPADFSTGNDPEACNATSSYLVVASGSPPPALSYTLSGATTGSGSGTGSGTILNMETTMVTIKAENLCGSTECSFDITVNDIEEPVISGCPSAIVSEVDAGQWGAMVTWTEPAAIDNCAMGTLTSSHSPGDFFNVGSTVVTYTATDESGNSSTCTFMVTVDPPEILGDVNLSIFANDIQFSNTNPPPGTSINVNASVHNTSNEDASAFVCHLVDQYSNISYPDVTVPALLANQSTIVSWVIETPAVPAFVPMQVTIDYLDSQDEPNELDNHAIRPFINGEFDFGGQIVVESNPVPSSTVAGNYISICGNAYYDDTAIPLEDSSVAGAQVTIVITETGQVLNGVTNAAGNFCISYLTANTPGTYHYTASVTDFTLTGETSETFILTPPPVEYCPKDLSVGMELFGSFLCGNLYHIVQGSSLTGVVHVTNSCQSVTGETALYIALPDGTPVPGPFIIPALAPGQTYDVALPSMLFNTPGATYISATVDYLNVVAEDVESNNTRNITLHVHPPLPDITPAYGQAYPHFQCTPGTVTFRIDNQGGVPTGSFVALLDIYQGATLEASLTQTVSSIEGLCYTYISFPFSPASAGLYQFNLYCDTMPDGVIELSETNNNLTFFHNYQPCNLDLTVHGCGSLDVKPTDPVSPGNITLYAAIGNYGQLPVTTPFVVNFDVEGTIYPVAVNTTLSPNTSYNVSVTVPTPPYGDNDLIVTVDGDNDVVELYETNNSQSAKLCWDFEVVNSKCSGGPPFRSTQYICNPIDLAIGVFNLGYYEASNLQVKFEVSGPGLGGWVDLGYATTFADVTCYCPHHIILPSSFYFPETGAYLVRITADFNGLYTECAEDNNQLILPVNVVENPDYAVYSQFIAPSDLNPDLNEVITFNLSYINEGCTGVSDVELFMDVDNTAHDSMPAMALPSGTVHTYPMAESWSSFLPGVHVIKSVIDHDNAIAEGNEMNNEATRAVLVGNAPNFNLFELVSSDLSPSSGENINLTASVLNEGESGADGVLQFYFVNAQGEEVLIDQFNIYLGPGETIVQPVVWIVTHPYAEIITRVINVDPLEYDYTDNERELQLNSLSVSISTIHVVCSGFDLGEMEAVITGGQAPYYVQWSNGQSGESINVPAGTYSAFVTDVNGLTAMAEDTVLDQALPTTWYLDADNDAFGDPNVSVNACVQPEDYVGTGTDCDDTNSNSHPGASELPDGEDNDCDGLIDEGLNSLSIEAGDCESVYFGYGPSSCQSLSVNVSGGTTPYTYLWSNGATTASTSVCPEETTIYTVVVTDHNGFTAQDVITVQVIDIRCGNNNDKVLVCHLPPGNPENVQMICIAPSAVQAHLDHGCYVGICEATDPCEDQEESMMANPTNPNLKQENHTTMQTHTKLEIQDDDFLTIYPNPADDYIEFQLPESATSYHVLLYDLSGMLMQSVVIEKGSQRILTSELASGVYFMEITNDNERMITNIVVMH